MHDNTVVCMYVCACMHTRARAHTHTHGVIASLKIESIGLIRSSSTRTVISIFVFLQHHCRQRHFIFSR